MAFGQIDLIRMAGEVQKAKRKSLAKAEAGIPAAKQHPDTRPVSRRATAADIANRGRMPVGGVDDAEAKAQLREIAKKVRRRGMFGTLQRKLEEKEMAARALMSKQAGLDQGPPVTTPNPHAKPPRPKSVYDVLEGPDLRQLDIPGAEGYLTWAGNQMDKMQDLQRTIAASAPGSAAHSTASANLRTMLTTPWGKVQSPAEYIENIVEKGNQIAQAAGVSNDELKARNFPVSDELMLKSKRGEERAALAAKAKMVPPPPAVERLGGRKPLIQLGPRGEALKPAPAPTAQKEIKPGAWAAVGRMEPLAADLKEANDYVTKLQEMKVRGYSIEDLAKTLGETASWKKFFKRKETMEALQEQETDPARKKILRDLQYEFEKEVGPTLSQPEFLATRGKQLAKAQKNIQAGRLSITKKQAEEALGDWDQLSDDERRLVISKIDNSKRLNLTPEQQLVLQGHRRNLKEAGFAPGELEAYQNPEALPDVYRYHEGVAQRAMKYNQAPKGALSTTATRNTDYIPSAPEGYTPVKRMLQGGDLTPRGLATTLSLKRAEKQRRAKLKEQREAMQVGRQQDLLEEVDPNDADEARRQMYAEETASKARYKQKRTGYGWFNDQREELAATGDPATRGAIMADSDAAREEWAAHQSKVRFQGSNPEPRFSVKEPGPIARRLSKAARGRLGAAGLGLPLLASLAGELIGDRL